MKPKIASVAAAFVAAGGLLIAGCTGGSQPASQANSPGYTPPPSPPNIVKTWGETATADGVRSTIDNVRLEAPTAYEGNPVQPGPNKKFVAVDYTAEAVGQEDVGPGFAEMRTDVGPATGVSDWQGSNTTELPTTMLPGDKATASYFFEVDKKAEELRLEIAPGGSMGKAEAYVHFRGPIPAGDAAPAEAPPPSPPAPQPQSPEPVPEPADPGPAPVPDPNYDPEGGVQFDENGYPIPGTGDAPGGYNPDTDPAPGPYDSPPNPDPAVPPGEGGMDQFEYGCQQGYIPPEQC